MNGTDEWTALLEKCARDYEDSAYACDSTGLARYRVERTKIAADLRRLAAQLSARSGSSDQAKIDERARLGQELIDSQAPLRDRLREESRR